MSAYECDGCGLTAMDLPDGVDPEFVFEREERGGLMLCQGCQQIPTAVLPFPCDDVTCENVLVCVGCLGRPCPIHNGTDDDWDEAEEATA